MVQSDSYPKDTGMLSSAIKRRQSEYDSVFMEKCSIKQKNICLPLTVRIVLTLFLHLYADVLYVAVRVLLVEIIRDAETKGNINSNSPKTTLKMCTCIIMCCYLTTNHYVKRFSIMYPFILLKRLNLSLYTS